MIRLAEIEGHLASMSELQDVVGAMRSLAGMRVQEAQHGLAAIGRYADEIAAGIGAALSLVPPGAPEAIDGGRRALILFAAEHGFVGGFNERLVEAAEAALEPRDLLFVLGSRGAALLGERGRPIAWTRPMATRLAAAPDSVRRLTDELYRRIARGEFTRLDTIFGRYRQGAPSTIEHHRLLPFNPTSIAGRALAQAPLHNIEPQPLLEQLTAEYIFALLTEAAVGSIASENAARFAAMQSAYDNVSKKLDELRRAASLARQDEITTELLDLVTGAEALRD